MSRSNTALLRVVFQMVQFCLLACVVKGAEADRRLIVPGDEARSAAMKVAREAFSADVKAAKSAATKSAVAKKMLRTAKDSKATPPDWYVLLDLARTTAAAIPDVDTALEAVEQMKSAFAIDSLDLAADTINKLAAATSLPDDRTALLKAAQAVLGQCVSADRYAVASDVIKVGLTEAKKSRSVTTVRNWQALSKRINSLSTAWSEAASALKVLKNKPDDPAANLAVGTYQCFDKGNWKSGLPLLAKSSDTQVSNLASRDLVGAQDPAAQLKLGDAWWELAERRDSQAEQIRARAAFWYRQAEPALAGLERIKVEHRINVAQTLANAFGTDLEDRTVDLLGLFAEHHTVIDGKWEMTADGLLCLKGGRLLINYSPPEEYDLHLEFTRRTGNDALAAICPVSRGTVAWFAGGWGNHAIAFTHLANGGWFVLTAHDMDVALQNGARYAATIRVRRDSIRAFLNGELVSELPGEGERLTAGEDEIGGKQVIGVMIDVLSTAMIYKMEVIEVSGPGKIVSLR